MDTNIKKKGRLLRILAAFSVIVGAVLAIMGASPSSVAATNGGGNNCYEQVTEVMYERPVLEYKYVKETREQSRPDTSSDWGEWSEWTVWNNGSTTRWEASGFSATGPHGGDPNGTYYREYRYVPTGDTRPSGSMESSGWVTSPPSGDGWVQVDQRVVNGAEIPCPQDPVTVTSDGVTECGQESVTINVNNPNNTPVDGAVGVNGSATPYTFQPGNTPVVVPLNLDGSPTNVVVTTSGPPNFIGNFTYTECPDQPTYVVETSHTQACGTVTLTIRNATPWRYAMRVEIDGVTSRWPAPDNGGTYADTSESRTITFEEDTGTHTVRYAVLSGTEDEYYKGLPISEWTTLTVETDCEPSPVEPTATMSTSLDCQGNLTGSLVLTVGDFRDSQGNVLLKDSSGNTLDSFALGLVGGDRTVPISFTGLDPDGVYTVEATGIFGDEAATPRDLDVSNDAGPAEGCDIINVVVTCNSVDNTGSSVDVFAVFGEDWDSVRVSAGQSTPVPEGAEFVLIRDGDGEQIGEVFDLGDCETPVEPTLEVSGTLCVGEFTGSFTSNPAYTFLAAQIVYGGSDGNEEPLSVNPDGSFSQTIREGVTSFQLDYRAEYADSDPVSGFLLVSEGEGCETPVEPIVPSEVTFVDKCGTENDGANIPDSAGVIYVNADAVKGGPLSAGFIAGVSNVKAIPEDGVTFAEDAKTEWDTTFTDVPCEETTTTTVPGTTPTTTPTGNTTPQAPNTADISTPAGDLNVGQLALGFLLMIGGVSFLVIDTRRRKASKSVSWV